MELSPLAHSFWNDRTECVRTIFIKDCIVDAQIGVYHSEKGRTQELSVSIVVQIAEPQGSIEDDIANVLDYGNIRDGIYELACAKHINLQETLCEALADYCLSFEAVQVVYVRLAKLEAFGDCNGVGCELIKRAKRVNLELG
jgi:dihydroneopterin aldolase